MDEEVFPFSVHTVEVTDSWAKNFKLKFSIFCSHATNIHIFEIPFCFVKSVMQPELNELQFDSILHSSFRQEVLITLYASLHTSQFSEFSKLS
jgi:hypothetical protein